MACGYSAEVHFEGGPNWSLVIAQLEQAERLEQAALRGEAQEKSDANFHRQYDRQIRLWGLAAQQRMTGGNAHSSNLSVSNIACASVRRDILLLVLVSYLTRCTAGAQVLVVGMRGLAAEVCKNIVLAGVIFHLCCPLPLFPSPYRAMPAPSRHGPLTLGARIYPPNRSHDCLK